MNRGSIPHLVLRADASNRVGSGHVMRCLALGTACQNRGGKAVLVSHCMIAGLRERVQDAEITFIPLDRPHPDPSDLSRTLELAREGGYEWVVLDGYHFGPEYQQRLREARLRLMVVDDMAHQSFYSADIILNQNIRASGLHYPCERGTHFLLGTQFALLRREFLPWNGWERNTPDVGRKVLVTLGGSDPDKQTFKVIGALKRLAANIEAAIVIGAGSHCLNELRAVCEGVPSISLAHNVTDMPRLMAWADIGVCAGGTTCWEMAFMGLPNVILVLADNQREIAAGLHASGAAWNLGWWEGITEEQIGNTLESLILSRVRRAEMSSRGRQLVDGKGADAVLAAMESLYETVQDR